MFILYIWTLFVSLAHMCAKHTRSFVSCICIGTAFFGPPDSAVKGGRQIHVVFTSN